MRRLLILTVVAIVLAVPAAAQLPPLGPPSVPGVVAPLIAGKTIPVGTLHMYNTTNELIVTVQTVDGWMMKELHLQVGLDPIPVDRGLNPIPGKFNLKLEPPAPLASHTFAVRLSDFGFAWGRPYESMRIQNVAFHADVVSPQGEETAWAKAGPTPIAFLGSQWGWWFRYELKHPMKGHFIDSPVEGATVITRTMTARTGPGGQFNYFPGESVEVRIGPLSLGSTLADHRVSPLDLLNGSDLDDPRVANMASLIQSLDADSTPQKGITILPEVDGCMATSLANHGLTSVDWSNSAQVRSVIEGTRSACGGIGSYVPPAEALENLERSLSASMFRKNVSKTPELATAKSKIDVMPVLIPALRANGLSAAPVEYFDENGNLLYTRDYVRPLVSVYADADPTTGAMETWGAVSRDDGKTWKRMNLARGADRSSFTLANGQPYYGDVKKPNLSAKDNYVLAVWQSKFCRGGRPAYSRGEFLEDGVTPNPYYADDIWGVGGPQRSHDYTEEGFPEVGELPFYCLWACRGVVDSTTGDIKWRKPERLTSGRRDVYQVAVNGAKGVGFGIVWQEDPEGVRPGEMAGPGHGWSGATTNHKTDIWYSSIKWSDFAKIDASFTPNGDPAHSFNDPEWTSNRPMWEVPFSLPIRLADNDVLNTDNLKVELGGDGLPLTGTDGKWIPINDPLDPEWDGKHAGTHRYGYLLDENANGIPDLCAQFHTFVNEQGATKNVCVTEDGRVMDGDTGASRPNIMFMPYTKKDGTQSAWVAIVYEETKGVGGGRPEWDDDPDTSHGEEKYRPDSGKNVIYHSFDFASPVKVSGGDIVNLPARDAYGNLLYLVDEYGQRILDWQGLPQLAYENARRPRMLVQPAGQAGPSNTVMVLVYKQGEDGKGRPSDIFMRRVVNPKDGLNPYAFKNIVCNQTALAENGLTVCVNGAQNISSVTPLEYWYNPNQDDQAKGEGVKVIKYEQTQESLAYESSTNPYEDARAHRGILRGDNLFVAYDHTPNWAASRNAHDKYDVYIRRSFDGGQTWTTDPKGVGDVCHTRIWKDYNTIVSEDDANQKETYEEVVCFAPGVWEPGRNMSLLKNNKLSVIEPRLVGPPGTTFIPGTQVTQYPEDVHNPAVFWLTFGTATNVPKAHGNDEDYEEHAAPADLFYTFTRDRGQTFFKRLWEVNPDSDGNWAGQIVERYDYLAKGDAEQGEAQIRMTPDGSRFYAVWNEEGLDGSDTWFRRIMSSDFPQNVGTPIE
jgi:hypothetical protein